MKNIQWKRVLRATIAALVFLYLAGNYVLARIYVERLVAPGCAEPVRLVNAPAPEIVGLVTPDGVELEGWYYPGANGAAIVALGGQQGALGAAHPPVAFLIDAGYGVLQIGSRACAGEEVTLGGREVDEAVAALRWLESRPEVSGVGIFGFSMGGVTAIRAAAQDPGFGAVAAEGGYFNLGNDIVEPGGGGGPVEKLLLYTIAWQFRLRTGVDPWAISPVDVIGEISPQPLLLVYGEGERESGRADLQYASAGEPKSLWIVPGGSHGMNYAASPAEYEARVLGFFEDWRTGE